MLKKTKNMRAFKVISEFVVVSSTVTLGVMNSIIPADPVGIAAALGVTAPLINQLNGIVERNLLSKNEIESMVLTFIFYA